LNVRRTFNGKTPPWRGASATSGLALQEKKYGRFPPICRVPDKSLGINPFFISEADFVSVRPDTKETVMFKLIRNEKGATAIEYGLIAALIAVAAIGAMQGIGTKLGTTFNNVSAQL